MYLVAAAKPAIAPARMNQRSRAVSLAQIDSSIVSATKNVSGVSVSTKCASRTSCGWTAIASAATTAVMRPQRNPARYTTYTVIALMSAVTARAHR